MPRPVDAGTGMAEPPSRPVAPLEGGVRFAYADPPYIGQARKHYAREASTDGRVAREVNHELLIPYLMEHDGWALSCSTPSLAYILPLCPPRTRIMAWVKGWASSKPGVHPKYAWEPVLLVPCRTRDTFYTTDWHQAPAGTGNTVHGTKPRTFSYWLFDAAGLHPDDELIDVFPGSGAVTRAWESWRASPRLFRTASL